MDIVIIICLFIAGLVIGSFINVCIYRIPRNKSIVYPNSFCPNCNMQIKWFDNIPVLSYILLKGKCRSCKKDISIRYPLIELFTALTYIILFLKFNLSYYLFLHLILFSLLIIIFCIDLEFMVIPDAITIPFSILALITNLIYIIFILKYKFLFFLKIYLSGSFFAFFLFLLIYLFAYLAFKREAFGIGDIKMGFMLGSLLGITDVVTIILNSFILGGILGFILFFLGYKKKEIPFGPFLVIATYLTVFANDFVYSIWAPYVDLINYILHT